MQSDTPLIHDPLINTPLLQLHSMALDATAPVLYRITSKKQLRKLWDEGVFRKNPLILGGGTNTVFLSDPERPVLKMETKGTQVTKESETSVWVTSQAGVIWQDLVLWAVVQQFGGIENLAQIPGSVGAAPVQNIGAYGVELSDTFVELEAFSTKDGTYQTFGKEECRFGYRDSTFKRGDSGWIICSVTLCLTRSDHVVQTSYEPLQEVLLRSGLDHPGIGDVYHAVSEIRASKLPNPSSLPNSGSFFKNPVITNEHYQRCRKSNPAMPGFALSDGRIKVPAAWLIEKTGWKGKRRGPVGIYDKHALVVVHYGGGTGRDLHCLVEDVKGAVQEKFDILLETEVHLIDDQAMMKTRQREDSAM